MFTAVLLICSAVSFGVEVNHQQQCAIGGPGVVSSAPVPGTYENAGACANAGYEAAKRTRPGLAAKSQVATWQCQPK
jgi:hypothetical protein